MTRDGELFSKIAETDMAIGQKAVKLLWANAAGYCSFTECPERLCLQLSGGVAPHTIGEMAHIKGENPGSNRHDPTQSPDERDSYANLILLCPTHHTLIDKKENEAIYSTDILHRMKYAHEEHIRRLLQVNPFSEKDAVAAFIYPLMKQNYEAFINFGPRSEIARRNPQSDAHKIWLFERLSTIVPNNRRILAAINANRELFAPEEQPILARFDMHVRSYELWVNDDITYEGVVRFPAEFEELIKRLVHACP